ncbi:MAG: hypothetical protein IIA92_07410 [Chloroflexi bacterium]|nr:hypothetical protein [Chloroflexota bacterium]
MSARVALQARQISRIDKELQQIESKWPNKPVDLLGGQEVDGNVRTRHLYVERTEDDERNFLEFELAFFQDIDARIPSRRKARNRRDSDAIDATLASFNRISNKIHIHCRQLTWLFPAGGFNTIITLPFMTLSLPDFPFDQISGVRFNSSSEQQSIILDRLGDGTLVVTAAFAYYDVIVPNLVEKSLEFAKTLIGPLVTERQEHDSDAN